jgi:3-hydroxyisobutyrate dehydrogenase-like beta-hydroxyacid dehydrogenase
LPIKLVEVATRAVGIIGLGLLGGALAERLHAAGYEVFGWDTNPANLQASTFVQKLEPVDTAQRCDRILLSLPNSAIVESVVQGMESALRPGTIVIDTTTGSPAVVEDITAHLAQRRVTFLDACVGGSSDDVRQRRAVVLCGGEAAAFELCRPIFDAIAGQTFHLGAAGTGTRMKLAFNLVLGLNRAVLAEGLEFARRSGINAGVALEILKQGAAYSRVMDTKGRKMIAEDFAPQARLSQHLKDVRHILEEGADAGALLPLSEIHARILQEVEAAGFGADDNSAVIRWFKGLS